jgi:SAM-dependent methyltransferase
MRGAPNYFAWYARLVTPHLGRRVLEVGCGLGNFTAHLLDRDIIVAIDPEPECIERLRERYGNRGNLHAFVRGVLDPEFQNLAQFQADSCVCLNVLEHVDDDIAAVRALASVLSPGGTIVLQLPAFPALYGPIDKNLNHYRRYNRRMIRQLARDSGLIIRKMHYANFIGFFGWWINAHILRLEAQSSRQIEFFDRYIVPVASAIERVIRPPFGQSLIAVLQKPGCSASDTGPAAAGAHPAPTTTPSDPDNTR